MSITKTWMVCLVLVSSSASLSGGCAFEGEIEPDEVEVLEEGKESELEEIEYSSANLLYNPGFESGTPTYYDGWMLYLAGWLGRGDGGTVKLVNLPHAGARSVRVADSTGKTAVESTWIEAWGGVRYELSAWTRSKAAGCSQYLGAVYHKRGTQSSYQVIGRSGVAGTGSTTWTKIVIRFTAPTDTAMIVVRAGDPLGICSSGTYEWDDFSLREL